MTKLGPTLPKCVAIGFRLNSGGGGGCVHWLFPLSARGPYGKWGGGTLLRGVPEGGSGEGKEGRDLHVCLVFFFVVQVKHLHWVPSFSLIFQVNSFKHLRPQTAWLLASRVGRCRTTPPRNWSHTTRSEVSSSLDGSKRFHKKNSKECVETKNHSWSDRLGMPLWAPCCHTTTQRLSWTSKWGEETTSSDPLGNSRCFMLFLHPVVVVVVVVVVVRLPAAQVVFGQSFSSEVNKVTLIPRGQAKGLTWFTPGEDQSLISAAMLKAQKTVGLPPVEKTNSGHC